MKQHRARRTLDNVVQALNARIAEYESATGPLYDTSQIGMIVRDLRSVINIGMGFDEDRPLADWGKSEMRATGGYAEPSKVIRGGIRYDVPTTVTLDVGTLSGQAQRVAAYYRDDTSVVSDTTFVLSEF